MKKKAVLTGARKNGWDGLDYHTEMTRQQRIAAKTKGIATLPNAFSLGGFGTSVAGVAEAANGNYLLGALMFLGGSTADLIDGKLARKYNVFGIVGEGIDAGLDKLRLLAGLGAFALSGVMPMAEAAPIAGTQVGIAVVSTIGNKRGKVMHADAFGKNTAFAATGAVASSAGAAAFEAMPQSALLHDVVVANEVGGITFTVTAAALGGVTLWNYGKQAFSRGNEAAELPLVPAEYTVPAEDI